MVPAIKGRAVDVHEEVLPKFYGFYGVWSSKVRLDT